MPVSWAISNPQSNGSQKQSTRPAKRIFAPWPWTIPTLSPFACTLHGSDQLSYLKLLPPEQRTKPAGQQTGHALMRVRVTNLRSVRSELVDQVRQNTRDKVRGMFGVRPG